MQSEENRNPKMNPFLQPIGLPKPQQKENQVIRNYLGSKAFSDKKVSDTPEDALSVVNRRYVNLNGSVASRPTSSVAQVGQFYYSTDTNIPMWFSGTNWRNGVGSVVA